MTVPRGAIILWPANSVIPSGYQQIPNPNPTNFDGTPGDAYGPIDLAGNRFVFAKRDRLAVSPRSDEFVCEWCNQPKRWTEHFLVDCPNLDDEHAICEACVTEFATADYLEELRSVGDKSIIRKKLR